MICRHNVYISFCYLTSITSTVFSGYESHEKDVKNMGFQKNIGNIFIKNHKYKDNFVVLIAFKPKGMRFFVYD